MKTIQFREYPVIRASLCMDRTLSTKRTGSASELHLWTKPPKVDRVQGAKHVDLVDKSKLFSRLPTKLSL